MDCINLAKLYACGEFSDCTLISSSGDEFEAHRLLLGQYPCFKHLLTEHRRVQLSEPTEVVERMLRWLYGVEWAPANIQSTRKDIGQELADIMNLCDAAKKVSDPSDLTNCLQADNMIAVRDSKAFRRCLRHCRSRSLRNHVHGGGTSRIEGPCREARRDESLGADSH